MMLLDRRRRPCFWVLGDNRRGPSISGEKEMARGTSREDLEGLDASVTALEREGELKESVGKEGEKERGDGEGGTHGPELQNWSRADRLSGGVTGLARFFCWSAWIWVSDGQQTLLRIGENLRRRDLDDLVQPCTLKKTPRRRNRGIALGPGTCSPQSTRRNSSDQLTNYAKQSTGI